MWYACNRMYLVGDRVMYEHKHKNSTECKNVPAVVTSVTPSVLCLTLDPDNSISGEFRITLHKDLKRCNPIRRSVFDGDVVNVSEQNAILTGVVRQDSRETIEQGTLDGFPAVRVQLMHQNRYVYPSLGDL